MKDFDFEKELEALRPRIARQVQATLRGKHNTLEADDITQDIIINCFVKRHLFTPSQEDPQGALWAWVNRTTKNMTTNCMISETRRLQNEKESYFRSEKVDEDIDPEAFVLQMMENEELKQALYNRIEAVNLCPRRLHVLMLRLSGVEDYQTIEEMTGIDKKVAKNLFYRAVKQVKAAGGAGLS